LTQIKSSALKRRLRRYFAAKYRDFRQIPAEPPAIRHDDADRINDLSRLDHDEVLLRLMSAALPGTTASSALRSYGPSV
jgi:hypothetical protein